MSPPLKGYLHLISNYRVEEKQLQEQNWRGGVHGTLELGVYIQTSSHDHCQLEYLLVAAYTAALYGHRWDSRDTEENVKYAL